MAQASRIQQIIRLGEVVLCKWAFQFFGVIHNYTLFIIFKYQFKAEFDRVVGDEGIVTSISKVFKESWKAKILLLRKKETVAKDIHAQAQEEITEQPHKKPGS